MRIDIATLFPEMCEAVLSQSIIGRARKQNLVELYCHNIRDFSKDKHRRVDDSPYGGGMGMVMQAEPIYQCFRHTCDILKSRPHVIYMSPKGKPLLQKDCSSLSAYDNIFILCGHYEGIDQRILNEIVDEEISIGDYVLTGGELPALVLVDSVVRLLPGVLSDDECFQQESHYHGLLEYPQYTRPEIWKDKKVPDILLSGHHANIEKWRREQSLTETFYKRKDLLQKAELSKEDIIFLQEKLQ